MKKLIGILIAFIFSFTILTGQSSKTIPKVSERDTLTINVISENPKVKIASDNLSSQLARNVENQYIVNSELAHAIRHVSDIYGAYLKSSIATNSSHKEIEFLQEFGYDKEKIKNSIKKQKRIEWFLAIPLLFLLLFTFYQRGNEYHVVFWKYVAKWVLLVLIVYLLLISITTLLFNPAYMDIIKLSKLMI